VIMVCGELDSSNADFSGVAAGTDVSNRASSAVKACQSFSAITRNGIAASFVAEGDGYVVYAIANLNVVFVHVPNKIAKTGSDTAAFHKAIAQGLLSNGKIIHLVIGDTNQGSADFTMQALNTAFQTKAYANALTGGTITKIDNYGVTEQGTNAKGTQLYDVAVYRSDVVQLKGNVAYLSQSSGAVTVTDHCGLGVVVELKSM